MRAFKTVKFKIICKHFLQETSNSNNLDLAQANTKILLGEVTALFTTKASEVMDPLSQSQDTVSTRIMAT